LNDSQKKELTDALQIADDFLNAPTDPSLEDYQREKDSLQSKIGPIFSSIYNSGDGPANGNGFSSSQPQPKESRGPIVEDVE